MRREASPSRTSSRIRPGYPHGYHESGRSAFFCILEEKILEVCTNRSAATRVPPPETRCKPLPGALGRRHPCLGSRSQGEVPVSPLSYVCSFKGSRNQLFGKTGSGVCSSFSRKSLNNLRDAAGGFPSFASFLALRINWRNVCTLISGLCSRNSDKFWSVPSTNRSLQASI